MATTTGYIDYTEQGSAPTTPSTGHWRVFTKSDGLYVVDDAGNVTGPLAAATSAANLESAKVTRSNIGSNLTYNSTTWADVDGTNLTITMTTGARRVMLVLSGSFSGATSAVTPGFNFSVDATAVVSETAGSKGLWAENCGTAMTGLSLVYITDVLTAASHTFKPRWNQRSGGGNNVTLFQSAADEAIVFSAVELLAD